MTPHARPVHHQSISGQSRQALLLVLWLAVLPATVAQAQRERELAQLRSECDALLQLAVQRPYGWAWETNGSGNDASRGASQVVSMAPRHTPAAAALLVLGADLLEEPAYLDAARHVARGMAAAQERSGRIPSQPIFAVRAGGRDEAMLVPDRAPTIASLAFLLILDEALQGGDEITRRTGVRAAHWLARQQTPVGGWPSVHPPNAALNQAKRIIRLDSPDYRNSTFALLLAGAALDDAVLARSGGRCVDFLLQLRLPVRRRLGDTLWGTTYTLDGISNSAELQLPEGADLLATRYALQTLMAAYLETGREDVSTVLDDSVQALVRIKQRDGDAWQRYPAAAISSDDPPGFFDPPQVDPLGGQALAHEMEQTLRAMEQLRGLGAQAYAEGLRWRYSPRRHMTLAMLGLMDSPLTTPPQGDPAPAVDEAAGDGLEARVARLWLLLRRVQEQQKG